MNKTNKLKTSLLILPALIITACSDSSLNKTYTITYELDGGVVTLGNPETYTPKTESFILNKAYKQGYIFKGWSLQGETTFDLNKTIEKGTKGDLVFVANYNQDYNAKNGAAVDVKPYGMKQFLALKDGETCDYIKRFELNSTAVTDTSGVSLKWTNVNNATSATITVATDENFEDVILNETTKVKMKTLYNLFPGVNYYVKVIDNTNDLIYKDSFSLEGHVRTIRLGNVNNTRDIGGWTIDDGSVIPYGRIYRSSDLQLADDEAKSNIKKLGFKTEIDLRAGDDHGTKAPVEGMNFFNYGIGSWSACFPGLGSGGSASVLANALKVYCDKANYPIVAHCAGGADRTGTLYFVLEALLGMNYEDMAREHELTTFSARGYRLRCGSTYNATTQKYEYDLKSTETDKSGFAPEFDKVYNYVLATYGTQGGTFKQAITKYVKNVLGLTDAQIESIRNNILN